MAGGNRSLRCAQIRKSNAPWSTRHDWRSNCQQNLIIQKLSVIFVSLVLAASALGSGPGELAALRREYEAAIPHGNEAARSRYVEKLAALLRPLVEEYRKTGVHKNPEYVEAINAALKLHPAPTTIDSQALSQVLPGEWKSPRHEYLFRRNGTWVMLPIEQGATNGRWRLVQNEYLQTSAAEPSGPSRYTLILLNADYFVYSDKDYVYFQSRSSK